MFQVRTSVIIVPSIEVRHILGVQVRAAALTAWLGIARRGAGLEMLAASFCSPVAKCLCRLYNAWEARLTVTTSGSDRVDVRCPVDGATCASLAGSARRHRVDDGAADRRWSAIRLHHRTQRSWLPAPW